MKTCSIVDLIEACSGIISLLPVASTGELLVGLHINRYTSSAHILELLAAREGDVVAYLLEHGLDFKNPISQEQET